MPGTTESMRAQHDLGCRGRSGDRNQSGRHAGPQSVKARPGIALPQPGGESGKLGDRKLQGDVGLGVLDSEGRHRARLGAFVGGVGAARAPRWSPFLEARNSRDFDMMAAALIPHLTPQKSFCVEISRERDCAKLVTDDAAELRAQLQAVTGERVAALNAVEGEIAKRVVGLRDGREPGEARTRDGGPGAEIGKARAPRIVDHDLGL